MNKFRQFMFDYGTALALFACGWPAFLLLNAIGARNSDWGWALVGLAMTLTMLGLLMWLIDRWERKYKSTPTDLAE